MRLLIEAEPDPLPAAADEKDGWIKLEVVTRIHSDEPDDL
jgi:hypothetical protein